MIRKRISKELRRKVFEKYNGHCAYCGCNIEMKDMQVDHMVPLGGSIYGQNSECVSEMVSDGTIDSIENLMPSCRECNYYKNIYTIDGFRNRIMDELDKTCRQSFQVRLAEKYGILEYKPWNGKFYFETH